MLYVIILSVFLIQFLFAASSAYRLSGAQIQKISTAKSVHDTIGLFSRLLHTFHYPLLVIIIEKNIPSSSSGETLVLLRWLLLVSLSGLLLGCYYFDLMKLSIEKATIQYSNQQKEFAFFAWLIGNSWRLAAKLIRYIPDFNMWRNALQTVHFPFKFFVISTASLAFLLAGNYACLYAGVLEPTYRMTALSLTGILNGVYSVVTILFIEMKLSLLTDQSVNKAISVNLLDQYLRVYLVSSIVGAVMAILFLPTFGKWMVALVELIQALG